LVFTSKAVINNVVKKLNLNIRYFTQGRVLESELYDSASIHVNFIAPDSLLQTIDFNFFVDITSETGFKYRINEEDVPQSKSFGENIPTFFGSIVVTPKNSISNKIIGENFRINVAPINYIVDDLRSRVGVYQSADQSKVLDIYLVDPIPK